MLQDSILIWKLHINPYPIYQKLKDPYLIISFIIWLYVQIQKKNVNIILRKKMLVLK